MAETIGRPATAKTGIRSRASLCHICDLQNGTWNGFSQSTAEFSCQHQCAILVFILTLLLSEGKAPNSGKLERKQLSFGCWGGWNWTGNYFYVVTPYLDRVCQFKDDPAQPGICYKSKFFLHSVLNVVPHTTPLF